MNQENLPDAFANQRILSRASIALTEAASEQKVMDNIIAFFWHVETDERRLDGSQMWVVGDYICMYDAEGRITWLSSGPLSGGFPRYFEAIYAENRIYVENAQADPRTSELREGYLVPLGITSMLDAGIMIDGKLAGVVCLEHTGKMRKWHPDEESFVSTAGSIIAQLFTSIARNKAEQALRKSEESYRSLIENTHDIIYILTLEGFFTFVSPSWTVMLGHPVSEVSGQSFIPLIHPDDLPACMQFLQRVSETGQRQSGIEYRVKHADGAWRWHTSNINPLKSDTGEIIGFNGTARDITERKEYEEKLYIMATTDALTGLWNRRSFLEATAKELERAQRYDQFFSLMMLDLDYFKKVNDTYGHAAGDATLKHLAAMMQNSLRKADIPGRLGGEEFCVLLPGTMLDDAVLLAERLRKDITKSPVQFERHSITYTVSIGVAVYTPEIRSVDELLQVADAAMYEAKAAGRNCVIKKKPEK